MRKLAVVYNPKLWSLDPNHVETISAREYLTNPDFARLRNVRVFNLSREYRYQSTGYYVSLLAEARNHRVIPTVTNIQDFKSKTITRGISSEIDGLIQSSLRHLKSKEFVLSLYFGQNVAKQYERLGRAIFNLFQMPLLRVNFSFDRKWIIQNIQPLSLNMIPDAHRDFFRDAANNFFARTRFSSPRKSTYKYDLAILANPSESSPPSNKKALQKFKEAAEDLGFWVDFVTKDDFSHITEYEALFIRETTSVNHHTYRFSRRAESEGLVVVDDPQSILRCTNKVYLAELMTRNKIPVPKTMIIHKDNVQHVSGELGLPVVLKKPDSSFSQGVSKAHSLEELKTSLDDLLSSSDLVIGQQFVESAFDWRIGILDRQILYACRYYMAKNHWQIYNWAAKGRKEGDFDVVPLDLAPKEVLNTALKAANLIGGGLYGVDVKEVGGRAIVIEINDNPSIDAGVEDLLLGDKLYSAIMMYFLKRLEAGQPR